MRILKFSISSPCKGYMASCPRNLTGNLSYSDVNERGRKRVRRERHSNGLYEVKFGSKCYTRNVPVYRGPVRGVWSHARGRALRRFTQSLKQALLIKRRVKPIDPEDASSMKGSMLPLLWHVFYSYPIIRTGQSHKRPSEETMNKKGEYG
jgi:hypothetical protein